MNNQLKIGSLVCHASPKHYSSYQIGIVLEYKYKPNTYKVCWLQHDYAYEKTPTFTSHHYKLQLKEIT